MFEPESPDFVVIRQRRNGVTIVDVLLYAVSEPDTNHSANDFAGMLGQISAAWVDKVGDGNWGIQMIDDDGSVVSQFGPEFSSMSLEDQQEFVTDDLAAYLRRKT